MEGNGSATCTYLFVISPSHCCSLHPLHYNGCKSRGCIILAANEVQEFAPKLQFDCNMDPLKFVGTIISLGARGERVAVIIGAMLQYISLILIS